MEENKEASLVGRYVKILVNKPAGANLKKGDYKIIKNADYQSACTEDGWSIPTDCYELMPKDFQPNQTPTHNPINPVPDFPNAKLSSLPQNWCIKVDIYNYQILDDFLQDHKGEYRGNLNSWKITPTNNNYFHYPQPEDLANYHSSLRIYEGFTVITTEEFKRWVMRDKKSKSWKPEKDMWVVLTEDYVCEYKKGTIWQLGEPQCGGKDYWYVQNGIGSGAPNIKKMRPATPQEIEAHLSKSALQKGITRATLKETRLEEAKRRFPIGAKFISPQNGKIYTLKRFNTSNISPWHQDKLIIVWVEDNPTSGEYLYYQGKWAEVVSSPKLAEGPFWIEGQWYKISSPVFRYPDAVMFIKYLNKKDTNQVWYNERVNVDGRHIINIDYANIKCVDGSHWIPVSEWNVQAHRDFKQEYQDTAKRLLDQRPQRWYGVKPKKEVVIIKQADDEEPTFVRVSHQRAIIMKQDE